ncbi:hypothetical protein [Humisphaera borealis]|uniref:Membrane protein 6-pyruvoyl-tetrahydropterin synthase-related domain-containing protein n=1 Tax=Humisphaera borealis TaxID=2807512 RepID=A0A7M2WUQ2_9BACT|nr:hypothetical protein [Humisphaera borealis]QOV89123.1 hypothetical protein IPV69_23355 [Humisphaera borealis]
MEPPGTTCTAGPRIRQPLLVVLLSLAVALIPVLPMIPMLQPAQWPNHPDVDSVAWSIAQCGRYFSVHEQFPVAIDSERFAGNAQPVFYAPILFPGLGLISNVAGAAGSLRMAVLAVWALQFCLVYRIGRCVSGRPVWSIGVATLVSWTIYPLNNLYHRGGLAEFIATGLLTCALCAGCLALLERRRAMKVALFLLCAWCGALAAGSHSITAVLGGLAAGCLALAALPVGLKRLRQDARPKDASPGQVRLRPPRQRRRALLGLIGVVGLTAAPWLHATALYGGRVSVAGMTGVLVHEPLHDSIWVRLMPLPLNASPDLWPHNNPQLNSPLLVLLGWTLFRLARTCRTATGVNRRRMVIKWFQWGTLLRVSLALLAISLVLSTSATLIHALPKAFSFIQYAYRLISYSNLAMLSALLAATAILGNSPVSGRSQLMTLAVWTIAIGLSATGLAMKTRYAFQTLVPAELSAQWEQDADFIARAPARYHAHKAYAVSDDSRLLANEPPATLKGVRAVALPVGTGSQFGVAQPIDVQQDAGGWVQTSVLAFPWNQMFVDDQPVSPERVREVNQQLAVYVPDGTHRVGYRPQPDAAWLRLRAMGMGVFVGLSVVAVLSWFVVLCRLPRIGRRV